MLVDDIDGLAAEIGASTLYGRRENVVAGVELEKLEPNGTVDMTVDNKRSNTNEFSNG